MIISKNDTLCMILARGGSKRIPRKNIRHLNGKPLVCYTFEAAIKSACFSEIIISTDDDEVADLARSYNITVDRRPAHLCDDATKAVEVIYEYLSRSPKKNTKNIAMLLPTCPFRKAEDIVAAVDIFNKHDGVMPLMAVTQYEFPPQLAVAIHEGNDTIEMCDSDAYVTSTRTQSIQPLYHPNGAIYLSNTDGFIECKTFFQPKMLSYLMPAERSFDIDYPYQMRIAEIMAIEIAQGNQ